MQSAQRAVDVMLVDIAVAEDAASSAAGSASQRWSQVHCTSTAVAMTRIMKKRPGGLKQAAAAASVDQAQEAPKKKLKLSGKDGSAEDTIQVPIAAGSDDDNVNEFAELKAIFDSALSKLGEGDAEEGSMLLRGVIHECDRILRVRDSADSTDGLEPLTWEFHFIYGSALYKLGLLTMNDDEEEEKGDDESTLAFLDAAVERFETGLEDEAAQKDWTLHQALGRVLIEKANILIRSHTKGKTTKKKTSEADLDATVKTAITHFKKTIANLPKDHFEEEAINVAEALIRHAEFCSDFDKHEELSDLARSWLESVLKENPKSYTALKCKGSSFLGRANVILDLSEGGDVAHSDELEGSIDEALSCLQDAKALYQSTETDVNLLLLLGEALVNKGNLFDEREEKDQADECYREAVKCFKKVESEDAGALPDQFDAFIKSWEEDFKDD
ncbi:inhibitor of Brome mosaic virus [Dinochytrium kinnereticum]|nr:inhibitor of Brome mosaic virus [Dinochytrium kinnereticum]